MKVIVYPIHMGDLRNHEVKVKEVYKGFPKVSAFKGVPKEGGGTVKVDDISVSFYKTSEPTTSPIVIEGTSEEFKDLINDLRWAIKLNEKWHGVKWEDLPENIGNIDGSTHAHTDSVPCRSET